jgi:hypothetical protein
MSLAGLLVAGLWLGACAGEKPTPADGATAAAMTPADLVAEQGAVKAALHGYVDRDRPTDSNEMEVAQIAIDSGWALVTWMHGEEGGQAVLRQQAGRWHVVECGPGWLGLQGVCREQVPGEVAKRLLDQIEPNWPQYETY